MSDWKPGDVAMVECSDGQWRLALCGEAKMGIGVAPSWMFPDHSLRYVEDSNARPLVVIDPEDREAVERLLTGWWERGGFGGGDVGIDNMQAALREFANPKPPKPDEPQGLGAVVEDASGTKSIRHDSVAIRTRWLNTDDCDTRFRAWDDLDVVRVLSEGVVDQ